MALTSIAPHQALPHPGAGGRCATGECGEKEAADNLAAAFLAEMLSFAGLNDALSARAGFGGEAMSGFLLQEYAQKIVDQGGFGLPAMILSNLQKTKAPDVE